MKKNRDQSEGAALFKGCVGRWIQDRQELILGGIPYAGIQDNVRHGDGDFIWKRNHTHTAVSWQDDPAPVFYGNTYHRCLSFGITDQQKYSAVVTDIGTDDFLIRVTIPNAWSRNAVN